MVAAAVCEPDGRFVFHSVPPGKYVVAVQTQIRGIGSGAEQGITVRTPEETVEIELALPTPSLAGRVADGDGHPIVADVSVMRERDGARLLVVHTDPDGSYRLAAPGVERFRLRVSAPGFADQETGSFGPDDPPEAPLEHVLEYEARLEIAVRDDDGAPIAGVAVAVSDAAGAAAGGGPAHWRGTTGFDGIANATRLPAGAFRVRASHAAHPAAPPATVDVEWGETRKLVITLTRVGRALLMVSDAAGTPQADVVVTLSMAADASATRTAATDAEGRATIDRLQGGRWSASAEGCEPRQFEVTPGADTDVALVVSRQ